MERNRRMFMKMTFFFKYGSLETVITQFALYTSALHTFITRTLQNYSFILITLTGSKISFSMDGTISNIPDPRLNLSDLTACRQKK